LNFVIKTNFLVQNQETLERLRLYRGLMRAHITRDLNKATTMLEDQNPNVEVILAFINRLEVDQEDLHEVNITVMDALEDIDAVNEVINAEIMTVEKYDGKVAKTLSRLRACIGLDICQVYRRTSPTANEYSTSSGFTSSTSKEQKSKLRAGLRFFLLSSLMCALVILSLLLS